MSTPCNSLNVQLIKVSDLATYSSIKDADQLMVIENTGGSKYSRKSTLSDLKDYANSDGISAVPSLVRVVLKCNSNDGRFVINQEVDVTSFFNNQTKPICSIVSSSSTVLLIVPTYTSITVYDYNSSTSVISQYNIDTTKWYLKSYAWK
jgi:hypothetical protein